MVPRDLQRLVAFVTGIVRRRRTLCQRTGRHGVCPGAVRGERRNLRGLGGRRSSGCATSFVGRVEWTARSRQPRPKICANLECVPVGVDDVDSIRSEAPEHLQVEPREESRGRAPRGGQRDPAGSIGPQQKVAGGQDCQRRSATQSPVPAPPAAASISCTCAPTRPPRMKPGTTSRDNPGLCGLSRRPSGVGTDCRQSSSAWSKKDL